MKRFFHLLIPTIIFCYAGVLAQTVTLSTYGVSPRDSERDTVDHYFDRPYNGLLNVGKETKMFFKASVDEGFLHPVWSIDEKPAGSTAEFGATKDVDDLTQIISFIPDLVGTYKISVTSDTSSASLTINSALYMGINSTSPNCVDCHNNEYFGYKIDEWSETGHASMLVRGLNGILSSHYGESCIKCHTTGYDPDANNNGFDDFPFVFPDSLYPGVYDMTVDAYPEAMQRANIQCESCHGPASGHNGLTKDSRIAVDISTDVCAYCHDEGTHHAFPEQWDYSGYDATEFDGRGFDGGHARGSFVQSAGTRSGCSPCHSGAGFIEWVEEGRPVNSDGLPTATDILPKATNISCAVCHDPHDATNEHQLRYADTQLGDGTPLTFDNYGTGLQCMQCHRSRRNAKTYAADVSNESSHYGAHHGPQADMLLGKNTPDFGIDLPSSPHGVVVVPGEDHGNSCVNCHMAGSLTDANGEISHVGGHTWNMNDTEGHDNVAACEPCHGDIGTSFKDKKYYVNGNADLDGNGVAEGLQLEIHGLMNQLSSYLPHDADGNVSITTDNADSIALTPAIMKSGYAYIWVEEDRSFGIHNPAFTFALLKAAIENLGGVLAVDYPKGEGMPEEYKLSQNYPNPFNPATTIEYSIPEQSMVTITIYDVVGKEIEQLYSGEKAAGTYSVQWNAANYASGIYFYKLSTNNFVQVKKMMLLK